jgi:hypothetical protein
VQDSARQATPIPSSADAPPANAVDGAVAREMATVNQRLFNNAYFRSIDALLLLASFRFATLIEWLPWLLVFTVAVLLDGYIVRQIKAKEFRQHDPELFALYTCGAIVMVCATVIGFVVPFTPAPAGDALRAARSQPAAQQGGGEFSQTGVMRSAPPCYFEPGKGAWFLPQRVPGAAGTGRLTVTPML